MTTDMAGAEAFYKTVAGWSAADSGMADMAYTLFSAGDTMVGGLMAIPEHAAGIRPGWLGYVAVDDVDAAAAAAAKLGGTIHRGPGDIPGVGRFAVAADPQGAVFVLFRGAGIMPDQPPPNTPGLGGWRELHTIDREAAFGFYAALLGWTKGEAIEMGPIGLYQLFEAGGIPAGGIMKAMTIHPPYWLYYFNVDAIEPAAERVKAAGGQVLNGPHPVPGGSWILHGLDPQGALFALLQPAA
jgi:predicted enzyme related to lactoylglutathione lyase